MKTKNMKKENLVEKRFRRNRAAAPLGAFRGIGRLPNKSKTRIFTICENPGFVASVPTLALVPDFDFPIPGPALLCELAIMLLLYRVDYSLVLDYIVPVERRRNMEIIAKRIRFKVNDKDKGELCCRQRTRHQCV